MNLRPYQIQTCNAIRESWKQFNRSLAVLPTGAGKTVISASVSKEFVDAGKRVLFLAHREELLRQTIDKFNRAVSLPADLEKAAHYASIDSPVVVGSLQTFLARGDRWPKDHFDLVIVDECHHVIADSYRRVLSRFDGRAKVLGITASPDRSDKRNLGEYFENVAAEVSLTELVKDGYLSRITVKSIPLEIDLRKVSQTAGDYDAAQLSDTITPYLGAIAEAVATHAAFRRVLAFLPLIRTSQLFKEHCIRAGLSAEHVDGYDAFRKEKLAAFAAGQFDVLCNAMLLTEGYDDPGIDCVIVLRPTRSRPLFSQMVGRGTRIAPFKSDLLLLDFLWLHERHSLVRPAHLVAKDDDESDAMVAIAQEKTKGGGEVDLLDTATEATETRHERLRKELESKRTRKSKLVDALDWALAKGQHDLIDYAPVMKWEGEPVTEPQARELKRRRIDPETVTCKGQASKLIAAAVRTEPLLAASPNQKRMMARAGWPGWETATAQDARKFFQSMRKVAA